MAVAQLITGLIGVVAGALAAALALFVFAAGADRAQNRILALLLFLMGAEVVSTFGIARLLFEAGLATSASPVARGLWAVNAVSFLAQPWLYLALLGTLDSPLARPWRSRLARTVLLALAAAALLLWPLVGPILATSDRTYVLALSWHGIVMLYGVAVAYSAYRRAPSAGSATRAKARAFLQSFAVRDLGIASAIVLAVVVRLAGGDRDDPAFDWADMIVPLSVAASMLLMGYGIARAHLFDIDVKVRLTISRGTVVAAFGAMFFVAAQIAQEFLGERLGWLAGGAAAGFLLFATGPLQRAGERFARVAMPHAQPLDKLPDRERAELYREQVQLAWADGHMGIKERRMLDAARERLQLPAENALLIEREAVAAIALAP